MCETTDAVELQRTERGRSARESLELGEVLHFPICPFPLPEGDDRLFLLRQRSAWGQKNINYVPATARAAGYRRESSEQTERLRSLLAAFSRSGTEWLARLLPEYAVGWKLDQVTYRPDEEANRRLPLRARNDLLHIDAFPGRPANGYRILRLFVNINLTAPRVWLTSLSFDRLFELYGAASDLVFEERPNRIRQWWESLAGFVQPIRRRRSKYDRFMLRFHDALKANRDFQQNGPKRRWSFAPGSAWLAITDTASHAVLSGRYALEHSYFVSPRTLALPERAPASLLERACGSPVLIS